MHIQKANLSSSWATLTFPHPFIVVWVKLKQMKSFSRRFDLSRTTTIYHACNVIPLWKICRRHNILVLKYSWPTERCSRTRMRIQPWLNLNYDFRDACVNSIWCMMFMFLRCFVFLGLFRLLLQYLNERLSWFEYNWKLKIILWMDCWRMNTSPDTWFFELPNLFPHCTNIHLIFCWYICHRSIQITR